MGKAGRNWPGVYDAYTRGRNGFTLRDEKSWKSHIHGQLLDGFIALVYDEKGPAGYMFYSLADRRLIVTEMAFDSEKWKEGTLCLYGRPSGIRG